MRRKRVVGLILLAAMLSLSACSMGLGAGRNAIDFEEIFEDRSDDELQLARTVELDVDEDGDDEWLVFYRYDPTGEERDWANTPIQAIAYDAIRCDPPIIHHWRLPFPDNDYLGEGDDIEATLDDWLTSSDPHEATQELIIEAPGNANTLSIYRFHDYVQNPCRPPDDTQQGFSLLGFFRANGDIRWDPDTKTVTTFQRTTFERSQLAIRSVYQPRNGPTGQTFIAENGRTKQPDEQSVSFLFGVPSSPLDSPYPEKAVAAFYTALGRDNEYAASFLTDALRGEFYQRLWGLDVTPDQIRRVLIYSISYTPDRAAELARQDREVTAIVAAVDQNNQRLPPRRVTWRLVGIPIPDSQDCEWRLAEIKSVIVTDGLGMLLPQDDLAEEIAVVR